MKRFYSYCLITFLLLSFAVGSNACVSMVERAQHNEIANFKNQDSIENGTRQSTKSCCEEHSEHGCNHNCVEGDCPEGECSDCHCDSYAKNLTAYEHILSGSGSDTPIAFLHAQLCNFSDRVFIPPIS